MHPSGTIVLQNCPFHQIASVRTEEVSWTGEWTDGRWPRGPARSPGRRRWRMLPSAVEARARATPSTPATPSLYDRLGGFLSIAAVVDRFSDRDHRQPEAQREPGVREWNATQAETRLPGLKFGRTLWMAAAAGGPFVYTGLPLDQAHAGFPRRAPALDGAAAGGPFHLTAEKFAEVGAEIVRALDYYGVPQAEQQELVVAYSASMPDVVTSPAD